MFRTTDGRRFLPVTLIAAAIVMGVVLAPIVAAEPTIPPYNTPEGTNVKVDLGDGVALTFSAVTSPGNTMAMMMPPPAGPPLGHLWVRDTAVDITTTAGFTGPVWVEIPADPSQVTSPNAVKVFHEEGGTWKDRTSGVSGYTITAQVDHFSPFMLGEPPVHILDVEVTGGQPDGTILEGDTIEVIAPILYRAEGTITATMDFGDGTPPEPGVITENSTATARLFHKFTDNGSAGGTIEVMFNPAELAVKKSVPWEPVRNKPPEIKPPPSVEPTPPVEGGTTKIQVPFHDAGDDSHTATIDPGDGTGPKPAAVTSKPGGSVDGTASIEHVYADDGSYLVTVTVTDDDGGSDTQTFLLAVQDLPPVFIPIPDQTGKAGVPFELRIMLVDQGVNDTHTVDIDWGDGSPIEPATVTRNSTETATGTHTYSSEGTRTVSVRARDRFHDAIGTYNFRIEIEGVDAGHFTAVDGLSVEQEVIQYQDGTRVRATFSDGSDHNPTGTADPGDGTGPKPTTTATQSTNSIVGTMTMEHTYADDGLYTITFTYTDDGGCFDTTSTAALILNSNPTVDAGTDRSGFVGEAISFAGSFTDVPADMNGAVTWWDFGDGGSAMGLTAAHAYATAGVYTAKLTVIDKDGGIGTDTVTVTVTEPNHAPVAEAGPNQTVHAGNQVVLDGSASGDVDGDSLTFAWTLASHPEGSAATLSDVTAVNPNFTPDLPGDYVFELLVNDGQIYSAMDSVTISTSNSQPVAEAGPDQHVTQTGSTIQLDGGQSYDPDGDAIDYEWSFVSKPAGSSAALSNAGSVAPTFVADVHGDYVLRLLVGDAWSSSTADTMTVSFENVKPVAVAGDSQSVAVGSPATLDGSASSDANGDTLTYSWSVVSAPAGSSALVADPSAQLTSFAPDVPGTYVIQLVVTDGFEASDASTLEIEAVTLQTEAIEQAQQLQLQIASLDSEAFKNSTMANALTNKINAVIGKIEAGQYEDALDQLENDILKKTDGAATTGAPDKNDWIRDVDSQLVVYPYVQSLILNVQLLLLT